jgi:hypothetical protein
MTNRARDDFAAVLYQKWEEANKEQGVVPTSADEARARAWAEEKTQEVYRMWCRQQELFAVDLRGNL